MDGEQKQAKGFSIIPAVIRYDKDLSAKAKFLYAEISALANGDEGYCFASNAYFEKVIGFSPSTTKRALALLTEKGYVKREIIYDKEKKQVIQRRLYALYDLHSKMTSPQAANEPTPQAANELDNNITVNKIIVNKEKDISKDISQKKEASKKLPFDEVKDDDVREALLAYRKQRNSLQKTRISERSEKMHLKKLHELAKTKEDAIAIIDQTINYNWREFYPLKENGNWRRHSTPSSPPSKKVVSEEEYQEEMSRRFDSLI